MSFRNRTMVSGLVAGVVFNILSSDSALGGANAGGVLLLHAHPEIAASGIPCPSMSLTDCENVDSTHDGPEALIVGLYAAFPGEPRVSGVTFGIEYDASIFVSDYGNCGSFEIAEDAWPNSGEGTTIAWFDANTESVQPVYWFWAYDYYEAGGVLSTIEHPASASVFLDDSIPAVADPIADFGTFGFNGAESTFPCPAVEGVGACCTWNDHQCEIVFEAECHGDFGGPDTVCDPDPCPIAPTGACCTDDGLCSIRTELECENLDRTYEGDGTRCQAPTCELTTHAPEATWDEAWFPDLPIRVHESPSDGGRLHFSWAVPHPDDSVAEIIDATGRRVLQIQVSAGMTSVRWTASGAKRLTSGSYWVRWTGGRSEASRFVVLR